MHFDILEDLHARNNTLDLQEEQEKDEHIKKVWKQNEMIPDLTYECRWKQGANIVNKCVD